MDRYDGFVDHITFGVFVLSYYSILIIFSLFCAYGLTNIALILFFVFVSGTLANGIVSIPCCIAACSSRL